MVADGGLRAVERFVEIARARLAGGGDDRDEPQAGGVGERLEQAGELDGLVLTHRCREERRAAQHGVDVEVRRNGHENILTDVDASGNISTDIDLTEPI